MTPERLPEPLAALMVVVNALDRIGAAYVIGGSFASSLYGEPRSTNDIDVVADLSAAKARRVVELLDADMYVSAEAAEDAARTGGSFNVIHVRSAAKIDVFVAGQDALDRERISRRRRVEITDWPGAVAVYVDAPEGVLLRKLQWFRRGGEVSERQWRDVVGILRVQGAQLDQVYLRDWARRIGVEDLLEAATVAAAG